MQTSSRIWRNAGNATELLVPDPATDKNEKPAYIHI